MNDGRQLDKTAVSEALLIVGICQEQAFTTCVSPWPQPTAF
jgi:hypothetical protein